MSSCGPQVAIVGGAQAGSSPGVLSVNNIIAEFDFSAMGSGNLTNGARNFTDTAGRSLSGTVINAAAATTFDLLAGTGMRFVANATSTQYTSAAQTATGIEFALDAIYTLYNFDATRDFTIEIYYSTLTIPSAQGAPAGIGIGLRGAATVPSNSIARYRGMVRTNAGGTQSIHSTTDATGNSAYTTAPAGTTNVIGLVSKGGAVTCLAGTWGGAWSSTLLTLEANSLTATTTTNSGFKDRNIIFAIPFATGQVSADLVATAERMIFRVN